MSKSKNLLLLLLLLLLTLFSLRAVAKYYEPRIVFGPTAGVEINPSITGIEYEDVTISVGRLKINGWYFDGKEKETILFAHGSRGNMADRIKFISVIKKLNRKILMIDYEGYGNSEGNPSYNALVRDLYSSIDWLIKNKGLKAENLILWGKELGTGPAIVVAQRYQNIGGLIIESGFVSIRRMGIDFYPYMPQIFISDVFNNGRGVQNILAPKLFLHGTGDLLVPFIHGEELYQKARPPKMFVPIKEAGHDNTYLVNSSAYVKLIGKWIEQNEEEN